MNKAFVEGNLGADVELRHTQAGTSVCNMRVATNDFYKDNQGETQKRTDWHRVVVYGKRAEDCARFLGKGSHVLIEGCMQTRSWEDRDGVKRSVTEIKCEDIRFLSGRRNTQNDQDEQTSGDTPASDYPF
jgi:single-strand DNA-binding protein